jgi:hypothetical protein
MKLEVEPAEAAAILHLREPGGQVGLVRQRRHLVAGPLERRQLGGLCPVGGLLGGVRLVDEPQLVDAFELVGRRLAQVDAGVGPVLDEPLGLELQERVADRAAADAEVLRERAVREPLPRMHPPRHDHPPQGTVGLRGQVVGGGRGHLVGAP